MGTAEESCFGKFIYKWGKKEGRNECLSLRDALYLGPELSCMALMGNFSCFTSLAAYHVLQPCFKAIFLFIPPS
jgi:hypothetical protein